MRFFSFSLYNILLALWIGGMFLFTFVVTPLIFKSYPRDSAGQIVGNLMPLYFSYNLALTVGALALLFLVARDHSQALFRVSLLLIGLALVMNLFVRYKLYPDTVRVKQEVASFERDQDAPARKKFTRLHAVSASLNLLVLADGLALLLIAPLLKR
jgi:uncharacterized membrane protein